MGNRLTETVNGITTTYAYNALDQLTGVTDLGGATTYDYDLHGNLIQTSDGADITAYAYDAQDRLVEVTLPDTTVIQYGYDADGRRVMQQVNTELTQYLWDETSPYGDVVVESDGGGTPTASYTLADTRLISQNRGGITSYYLPNAQGSTRLLADVAGTVTDRYAYTAFGELHSQTGNTVNLYLYTGQQYDDLTELYSLRARYYDTAVGRFLSRDLYLVNLQDPLELNRYVYGANNPITLIDPTGNQCTLEWGATALVLAALGAYLLAALMSQPQFQVAWRSIAALLTTLSALPDWESPERNPQRGPGKIVNPPDWTKLNPDPGNDPGKWLEWLKDFLKQSPKPFPLPDDKRKRDPNPQKKECRLGIDEKCTEDDGSRIIVELGAGNYSNARAMKIAHPKATVIATNLRSEWEEGKMFSDGGLSPIDYPQVDLYLGWKKAKAMEGMQVGNSTSLENANVASGIGDLVYTILPYPRSAEQFGRDAARIASTKSGTIVAVTEGGRSGLPGTNFSVIDMFERGFNTLRPGSKFEKENGSPYGKPGNWESGPYTTGKYVVS